MSGQQTQYSGNVFELLDASMPGAPEITKRIVFGPDRYWPDYVMRCFTLEAGSAVPPHTHDWPHYVVILQGSGSLDIEGRGERLDPMSWAYVPPHVEHSFRNTGDGTFIFLCIVPKHGDVPPGTKE